MKGFSDMKWILVTGVLIFLAVSVFRPPSSVLWALYASRTDPNTCPKQKQTTEAGTIDEILARLHESAARLKTYQAEIRYLFIQDPELLDSQTLRKGELF